MATVVLNIKTATLKLAANIAGLTTGKAYSCQITSAEVVSVPKLETVPATMCTPESQSAAASGWELHLGWLQDWGTTPDSLSQYLFDNDAKPVAFEMTPTDPTMPKVTGTGYAVAGAYGGDMGTNLLATATIPLTAKPTVGP